MSSQIHDEEELKRLRSQIVETARNILAGECGVVAGAWKLNEVGYEIGAWPDSDFRFFTGIISETDHLPSEKSRRYWNPEALKSKDAELEAYETNMRERVFEACQRLIEKYAPATF